MPSSQALHVGPRRRGSVFERRERGVPVCSEELEIRRRDRILGQKAAKNRNGRRTSERADRAHTKAKDVGEGVDGRQDL